MIKQASKEVVLNTQDLKSRRSLILRISNTYGVKYDKAKELLTLAEGTCDCCGEQWKGTASKRLHIDHDHKTGAVRGVLCRSCNIALGLLKDSNKRILQLYMYAKERC